MSTFNIGILNLENKSSTNSEKPLFPKPGDFVA